MIKKKLKVLHVFSTIPVGGAEVLMFNIAKNIDNERFDLSVYCMGDKGAMGRQIEDLGVNVVAFDGMKGRHSGLSVTAALFRYLKKTRFDIVHTHMYHAGFYGRIAARLAGVPVVLSFVHNVYRTRKLHRMIANRLLWRITDRVCAGTRAVMEDVQRYDKVPAGKIEIIPYGIDTHAFMEKHDGNAVRAELGLSPLDKVIGNVARLEHAKGQRFLIESLALLRNDGLDVRCILIGAGSLETELKDMAKRLGVFDSILFLGTRHDLPRLFSAMDIFVFPSLWEGLPLALLSAMAAGLPVITTLAGGIGDVIVDGKNGLAVPFRDPLAIAAAVRRLYSDAAFSRSLAVNAQQAVENDFSAKAMTRRIEGLYEKLWSSKGAKIA
jgi:glycosyltransferase involved in cell wall biosynthesis